MPYYNPMQVMMLQAHRNNPQMLAQLRGMYSQVKPMDETSLDNEAKAKQSEFLSGQVAPELARIVSQDANGNTGSFGAARQASLIAEGQRRAQDVFAAARSAALEREMALQRLSMEQEDRAFNQQVDNYGMDQAENQVQRAMGARDNLDRYIEGGAAAVNGLGRMFATGFNSGVNNPLNKFGSAITGAFRGIGQNLSKAGQVASAPLRGSFSSWRTPLGQMGNRAPMMTQEPEGYFNNSGF